MSVLVEGLTTEHETKAGAHQISGISGLQGALDGKYSPSNKPSANDVGAEPSGSILIHEEKLGAHDISGVEGLQVALDDINSKLSARNYTTLIPASYPSGAPHDTHETVSSALPTNIATNMRYVLQNPFGINSRVQVVTELYLNGKWSVAGYDGNIGTGLVSVGTVGAYVQGEGVIVQTGANGVASQSALLGGGHGITSTTTITTAPCRVFVSKLEA